MRHRLLGSFIVIICICWISGAGTDPIRRDAQNYFQSVVHPLAGALQEIHQVDNNLDPDALSEIEVRLLPAYRRILSRARTFKPRSPVITRIHTKMVKIYTAAVQETEIYLESARAGNAAGVVRAHKALWALDFGGVERDLQRLSDLYHLDK
jgi:hypothetical protein